MTDTPEAVRLADQIHAGNGEWMQKAAALLRRIPGLEAEVQEQARLNGMGAERELALMAQVSRLEAERDQLRAELEKVRNIDADMVDRMKAAIEGECDGLAVDEHHAMAILEYVLTTAPTPPNADQKGQ